MVKCFPVYIAKVGKQNLRWPEKLPVHLLCALYAEDKKKYLHYHKTYTSEQTPQLTGVLRQATVPIYVTSHPVSASRENFNF